MISKIKILLSVFVIVVHVAAGQTLPNTSVWGNTLLSAKTENSDTSGNISISQLNNALYYNINNVVNVPVTNRIIYSNGANLTSNAGLTYSGSSFGVTGTGVFTSTVSGANASSASHFTTLSQLQSSVSGTTNYMTKFTGTNTVGNSSLQDDGNRLKMTGKPLHQEYATTTNLYKDVATFYNNTGSNTGAIVFELPATSGNNQMLGLTMRGYSYTTNTGGGAFTLFLGGYAANGAWLYPYAELTGYAPFSTVTLAYNSATSRYVIILGTVSTTWAYPKIVITELLSGFGVSNQLASSWTTSLVTDLSAYSSLLGVSVAKNVKTTNEISAGLSIHKDLITYKSASNPTTGAMIIETPIVLAANQMNSFVIYGVNQDASKAGWEVRLSAFFFNNSHTPNYCEVSGDNPFGSKVRIAYNTVTSRYSIILGDTNTVWRYPTIILKEVNITHSTALNMGAGWSVAPQTSLVNYSNITTPSTYVFAYLEKNQTFPGNQTFTGNVIVPNSTTSTHALNVATGDARYLGITATATNSNALRGLDTNSVVLRNAVQTVTQRTTFTKNTPVGDAIDDGDAMSKYLVENRVGKNSDTITLYSGRAGIQLTPYSSLMVFNNKVGTVNFNTTINLDAPADNNMHTWEIFNTQLLASGATFTINAPSGYTFSFNLSSTQFVAQYDPADILTDQDIDFTSANFSIKCTAEKKSQKCRCSIQTQ